MGRIVYITCSVLKDENENIIEEFLSKNNDFALVNIRLLWEQKLDAPYPCGSEVYLRMSPQATGTDGFFVCVLKKRA